VTAETSDSWQPVEGAAQVVATGDADDAARKPSNVHHHHQLMRLI